VLEKHIAKSVATIYTDGHPIYVYTLRDSFPGEHKRIDHNVAYGIGSTHTNTIENAFPLLKRGLHGTFHQVSKKHLGRYCDEFSYRFNRRKQQANMFAETTSCERGTADVRQSYCFESIGVLGPCEPPLFIFSRGTGLVRITFESKASNFVFSIFTVLSRGADFVIRAVMLIVPNQPHHSSIPNSIHSHGGTYSQRKNSVVLF
jgi:hypothetical protein